MKEHFKNCSGGRNGGASSHFFAEHLSKDEFGCSVGSWTPEMDQAHSDWCREHFINPSSVKAISQYIEITLKTLYRSDFEPEWLRCQPLESAWNRDRSTEVMWRQNVITSLYGIVQGDELSTRTLILLQGQLLSQGKEEVKPSEYACIHFLNDRCIFGDDCKNSLYHNLIYIVVITALIKLHTLLLHNWGLVSRQWLPETLQQGMLTVCTTASLQVLSLLY